MMSRISSGLPIFAISYHKLTLNLTSLYRGVTPIFFNNKQKSKTIQNSVDLLCKKKFLFSRDLVILTKSSRIIKQKEINTIYIVRI